MDLKVGTRVRATIKTLVLDVNEAPFRATGTVLHRLGEAEGYMYEVVVDNVDPGPHGVGNRYIYHEYELTPL